MNEEERFAAVSACKWVDEVVRCDVIDCRHWLFTMDFRGVPYVMNEEYLNMILDKYQIDYVCTSVSLACPSQPLRSQSGTGCAR